MPIKAATLCRLGLIFVFLTLLSSAPVSELLERQQANLEQNNIEQTKAQQELPVLRLGYIEFPPFYYTDSEGNAAGTLIQLAQRMATKAGYRLEAVLLPARRLIGMVANAQVDIAMVINTIPELKDRVLSSQMAVGRLTLCVYSSSSLQDFMFPQSVAGKRVTLVRGYSYSGLVRKLEDLSPPVYLLEVVDHQAGLQALYGRKLDYLFGYQEVMESLPLDLPLPEAQVLQVITIHVVVPTARPNAQALLSELEQALQIMASESALQ